MNEEGDFIEAPQQQMDDVGGPDGGLMNEHGGDDCNMNDNLGGEHQHPDIEVGFEEMEAHGFGNYS